MALNIFWTPQAEKGLNEVLEFLEEEWTAREIMTLEQEILELTKRITRYPKICPPTGKHPNIRKGLVDKNNYIIYPIRPRKKIVEIINFRGTKQKPLK
jgi:plasmid stabilization system protein ParE